MDIRALYLRWLRGEPLRALGRDQGCSHTKIRDTFHRAYGRYSTDPVAKSLARSLAEDYPLGSPGAISDEALWDYAFPDKLAVEALARVSNGSALASQRHCRNLTRNQVIRDPGLLEHFWGAGDPMDQLIEAEGPDPRTELNFFLLVSLLTFVVNLLYWVMCQNELEANNGLERSTC